jgi:hypothetical protein
MSCEDAQSEYRRWSAKEKKDYKDALGSIADDVKIFRELKCSGCNKVYAIGDDAVVVAAETAYGLVGKTVVSGDTVLQKEDLVSTLDGSSPDRLQHAKEAGLKDWKIILEGLTRGQSRTWRCHSCNKANEYS